MKFKLRDYQQEVCDAAVAAWEDHQSLAVVLPTGCGKTEIFVQLASQWEEGRTLVIAPTIELVAQAAKKLAKRTGIVPGIEQGILRSNETEYGRSPFVVASKQSLTSKSERFRRFDDIGLVIVDECHLAATSKYAALIKHFTDSGAKVLGVTATPKRTDKRALGQIFDHVPYNASIADFMPLGWLVPAKTTCCQITSMDLSAVKTNSSSKDFRDSDLAKVMEQDQVVFEISSVVAQECAGLKTVVYVTSVEQARMVAEHLRDHHGMRADWVCGDVQKCSPERRKEVLDSFTQDSDGIEIVCNVGVLTTGWDYPGLECIVMASPTKSIVRYTQVFGRGTRPLEGVVDFPGSTPETRRAAIAASAKPHFKVVDLVDNAMRHKLISVVDVLGGHMTLVEQQRCKELMEQSEEILDMDEVEREAKRQLKEEAEARERAKRAAIAARAEYDKIHVNPYARYSDADVAAPKKRGMRMLFGKHKGELLSDVPRNYLMWMHRQDWFKNHKLKPFVAKELGMATTKGDSKPETEFESALAKLRQLRSR